MPKFAFRRRRQSAPRPEERRRRGWRPVARHGGTALWSLAGLLAGGLLLGLMLWHGGGGNGAPGGYGGPVAEAQTICDEDLPIEALQALAELGLCDPPTPTPAATAPAPLPTVCATAPREELRNLILAGYCGPTPTPTPAPAGTATPAGPVTPVANRTPIPTPTPTAAPAGTPTPTPTGTLTPTPTPGTPTPTPAAGTPTPTPAGTLTPTPAAGTPTPTTTPAGTPTPTPAPTSPNRLAFSSYAAGAGLKMTLTVSSAPDGLSSGSSVEIYLDEEFRVPETIDPATVYFTLSAPRNAATGDGGRVYASDPIEVEKDDHFGAGRSDWAIRALLPDLNASDNHPGFQGPAAGQTLTLTLTKAAGVKNPAAAGDEYRTGYSVLGPVDDGNEGPRTILSPAHVSAQIDLSDSANVRDYELTVTGQGFKSGTTVSVHALAAADADDNARIKALLDGGAREMELCSEIIRRGTRVGKAEARSSHRATVKFKVRPPAFRPGRVNYLCAIDGEGSHSGRAVRVFHLEPGVSVSPAEAGIGDVVTVRAEDFPNPGASFQELRLAGQRVYRNGGDDNAVTVSANDISTNGSASITFPMPGSAGGRTLEGEVRVEAVWGTVTGRGTVSVSGSGLTVSRASVRANESVTINGDGFGSGSGNYIRAEDVTLDGVPVLIDHNSLDGDRRIEVSSSGRFFARIYLWSNGSSNPALSPGQHTLRARDRSGHYGEATVTIKEPSLTVTPAQAGPRQTIEITGADWPVDNPDSDAHVDSALVKVEGRSYTAIPNGAGSFTVRHIVRRDVGIPSTNRIEAIYGDSLTRTAQFTVPSALIVVTPPEARPGDEFSVHVTGLPTHTTVEQITVGGAAAAGGKGRRTDQNGELTADELTVPGLDPGDYSVVVRAGAGAARTVSIGTIKVLPEAGAASGSGRGGGGGGAAAAADADAAPVYDPLPDALEPVGELLDTVFYFDNARKEWDFYDPRPAYASFISLKRLQRGEAYWIKVTESAADLELNGVRRDLTCVAESCWNLVVW